MRALWITCHLPFPAISGGRLRELELLRRIAREVDVHVVAVSKDPEHDRAHTAALRAEVPLAGLEVHATEPDADAACVIVGRHASPPAGAAVRRLLAGGDLDLVHVEGFYLAQHVPEDPTPPIVLADQNVEFDLWQQRTGPHGGAGDDLMVSQWRKEAQRCQAAELAAWRRATQCVAVTEDDAALMRRVAPDVGVRVVPDGADHLTGLVDGSAEAPRRPQREVLAGPRLLYVGNYAYEPNVDAVRLLLDEVLPRVRSALPTARLTLVGNAPPPWLQERARRDPLLEVTGRVPEIAPRLAACDLLVLPLRIGGGVKVKVLEGLAAGVPIVTTPVGAQGLPAHLGAPLVVDAEPERFAAAVIRALQRPCLREALGAAALQVAAGLPTWDDAADALLETYAVALAAARARTA